MWADRLCIGYLSQWAVVGRENSNMFEIFCTTLYSGVLYELLLFMKQDRNFNFTVVRSPDGYWGSGGCISLNETVGMMGMVARSEVDLAIGNYYSNHCAV